MSCGSEVRRHNLWTHQHGRGQSVTIYTLYAGVKVPQTHWDTWIGANGRGPEGINNSSSLSLSQIRTVKPDVDSLHSTSFLSPKRCVPGHGIAVVPLERRLWPLPESSFEVVRMSCQCCKYPHVPTYSSAFSTEFSGKLGCRSCTLSSTILFSQRYLQLFVHTPII